MERFDGPRTAHPDQHDRRGRPPRRGDDGFTLVELLAVVTIIGVLAGIAVPGFLQARNRAHDAAARHVLRSLAPIVTSEMLDCLDSGFTTCPVFDASTLVDPEQGGDPVMQGYLDPEFDLRWCGSYPQLGPSSGYSFAITIRSASGTRWRYSQEYQTFDADLGSSVIRSGIEPGDLACEV